MTKRKTKRYVVSVDKTIEADIATLREELESRIGSAFAVDDAHVIKFGLTLAADQVRSIREINAPIRPPIETPEQEQS